MGKVAKAARKPAVTKRDAAKSRKVIDRTEQFLAEYLLDFNGSRAAQAVGYSPASSRSRAHEMLRQPDVQAKLAQALVERAARTELKADDVVRMHRAIAEADPRELCELQRGCCRYCWGTNHHYQRTQREMDEARANYADYRERAETRGEQPPFTFDEIGGTGWNPTKDPNPQCPECFGEGVRRVIWKDTRDLSPGARLLYAGVEETQNGLKIRMRDQDAHVKALGQHLGIYKMKHEHTGKDGEPLGYVVVPAKRVANDVAPAPAETTPAVAKQLEKQLEEKAAPARKRKVRVVSDE